MRCGPAEVPPLPDSRRSKSGSPAPRSVLGSTGRQHVLDAFHQHGLAPTVGLETTSTETVVSMVEAGLGVAIVPLMANGAVTRNRRVDVRGVRQTIRPIHSGVLLRRGETPSPPVARLLAFLKSQFSPG